MQSAYFGQSCFSIFTACCYLTIDGVLKFQRWSSEANDYSRIAALSCWLLILSVIKENYPNLPDSLVLHIWSNGCKGQFRLRFAFSLLSKFAINHTLFWYSNERHHKKGPMDGIGGTSKHRVFRDVKSEKVSIKNAEHVASYVDSILNGITSLYMPLEEISTELESVSKAPKIPGTLEVHMI